MLRVRSPQDLGVASVIIVIGLAGLYLGKGLTFGTASQIGPDFFPTWLLAITVVIIALIVLPQIRKTREKEFQE